MSARQRSRRRLTPGIECYLCEHESRSDDRWNRDHAPTIRIFASGVRQQFSPQLEWLPTHDACNGAYRQDEEYFVASFAGHVLTPTATGVMQDLGAAAARGHGVGLLREVISRFGRIEGPNGELLYQYNTARVNRSIWKVTRELYGLLLDRVLPDPDARYWRENVDDDPELEQIVAFAAPVEGT